MERQERIAVVPGSFDPITKGHMDIIRRAQTLFDKVIVLVVINAAKNPCFSLEERVELIKASVEGIDSIEVDCFSGLLVDYVKKVGACAIVKGLRAVSDFEYEFQQALINKELYSGVETVFFTTSAENQYLSSSVIKQIASLGGNIRMFVPEQVHDRIVQPRIKGLGFDLLNAHFGERVLKRFFCHLHALFQSLELVASGGTLEIVENGQDRRKAILTGIVVNAFLFFCAPLAEVVILRHHAQIFVIGSVQLGFGCLKLLLQLGILRLQLFELLFICPGVGLCRLFGRRRLRLGLYLLFIHQAFLLHSSIVFPHE